MDKILKGNRGVSTLSVYDIEITDDNIKPKELSLQYKSVLVEYSNYVPYISQKMPENNLSSLVITEQEVLRSINKLNTGGAPGEDENHPFFIKKVTCFLTKPLTTFFNKYV